mgnify:CR=1 FL=1
MKENVAVEDKLPLSIEIYFFLSSVLPLTKWNGVEKRVLSLNQLEQFYCKTMENEELLLIT